MTGILHRAIYNAPTLDTSSDFIQLFFCEMHEGEGEARPFWVSGLFCGPNRAHQAS